MFISLGGNCAITYQLNKHKVRDEAYPFDWCKIDIKDLIQVLKNNFKDYDNVDIYCVSNKHKKFDNDNNILAPESTMFKNKYCLFAHEVDDKNIFCESLKRRIERFKKLSHNTIKYNKINSFKHNILTFIRLELKRPTYDYMNQIIRLCEELNKYFDKFILKIIIHKSFQEYYENYCEQYSIEYNVRIYYFDEFSDDWKFDLFDWKTQIFE